MLDPTEPTETGLTTPRPRCPAHGLAQADDGLCVRCRGPEGGSGAGRALLVAFVLGVLVTLWGSLHEPPLVAEASLGRFGELRGQMLETTAFVRDEAAEAAVRAAAAEAAAMPPPPEAEPEPETPRVIVVGPPVEPSAAPAIGVPADAPREPVVTVSTPPRDEPAPEPIVPKYANRPQGPPPPPRPQRLEWPTGPSGPPVPLSGPGFAPAPPQGRPVRIVRRAASRPAPRRPSMFARSRGARGGTTVRRRRSRGGRAPRMR